MVTDMDDNLILQMPFDEKDGSKIAYDYSKNRADGVVDGARFVSGHNGNAISFGGNDTCEIAKQVITDFEADYTIMAFLKVPSVDMGEPQKLFWMFTYPGLDKYDTFQFEIDTEKWSNVALVHHSGTFKVYIDGILVGSKAKTGDVIGVSLNQQFYSGNYGYGEVDDFKIYSKALDSEEILIEVVGDKHNAYTVDGVDFKDYGVFVSASDGVLSRPKLKKMQSRSWDDYHGDSIDRNEGKYYESREITLSCFMHAASKMDFIANVAAFERLFDNPGLSRLVIDVHPTKPLIYEVYCKDIVDVKKEWSERDMLGTFKLKLVEPEPLKRVLRHFVYNDATKECQITVTTDKYVNIYWGDGQADYDISGTGRTVKHQYTKHGIFFPVITGCIDEINAFSTNAIIVWDRI
ncbi:MAG: LamG domain-containing protein [Bacteroides sp.]|nr:LamG domain-containing protein [Bacteroides sp.]